MMRFLCIDSIHNDRASLMILCDFIHNQFIPYRVLNHTFSKQLYPIGYKFPHLIGLRPHPTKTKDPHNQVDK